MCQLALVIVNFFDADQTLRNHFAERMLDLDWCRYPGVANSYVTTILGKWDDDQIADSVEEDLQSCAEAVGLTEWDSILVLNEDEESLPKSSVESVNRPYRPIDHAPRQSV